MRIAIIGSGVSGGLAARLLSTRHEVTLFEADNTPGGHAHTVDIEAFGKPFSVDTGFMVFNRRTYPNFCRLLELLDIPSQPSDMSFSVRCEHSGLEYQGSSLNGLFSQRLNSLSPPFWRMIADILRFNRRGTAAAASGELRDGRTVGDFLARGRFGRRFVQQYFSPMAAAIWSSDPRTILDFPAEFMIGFFANHGLMQVSDRPQWRTVVGGSRSYVEAMLLPIQDRVRLGCPIELVDRSSEEVVVKPIEGPVMRFDQVVFATHADQTLRILAEPTPLEREVLSEFPYQPNHAVLHTDTGRLPSHQRAWASWNYRIPASPERAASVTYDLSRLQNHASAGPILLTLNPNGPIDPASLLDEYRFHHPAYTPHSLQAQRRFAEINGKHQTHFCGAYWGYGFHEDGVNSALAVAAGFGINLESLAEQPQETVGGV